MSWRDLEKLVHAFIFSRLNYCHGVLTGLSKLIHQTSAADSECCCLSPNKNQRHWITSHLRPLNWLPACQIIDFNRLWGSACREWSSVDTNLSASAAFSKRCTVLLCFYFQGFWISQKRRKPLLAICFLTVSKALLLWAVSLLQSGKIRSLDVTDWPSLLSGVWALRRGLWLCCECSLCPCNVIVGRRASREGWPYPGWCLVYACCISILSSTREEFHNGRFSCRNWMATYPLSQRMFSGGLEWYSGGFPRHV